MTSGQKIALGWGVILLLAIVAAVSLVFTPKHPSDLDCPQPVIRQADMDLPVGVSTSVVLELPPELRTKNWGGGSCVHASNVTLLRRMDMHDVADWWRKTYSGGEYDSRLVSRLEKAGLRYAYINDPNGRDSDRDGKTDGEEFLEWCCATRRGAGIFYKPVHSINLAGMDDQYAYLLDNNDTNHPERTGEYERVPKAEFMRRWRGFGGFAWTIIAQPVPSEPRE